jgi:hypothetical protein
VVAEVERDLAQIFGAEQVQGLAKLVDREWLVTEHSEPGSVSKDVWEGRKTRTGGGRAAEAFEVRHKVWMSENVSHFLDEECVQEAYTFTAGAPPTAPAQTISSEVARCREQKVPYLSWFSSQRRQVGSEAQ